MKDLSQSQVQKHLLQRKTFDRDFKRIFGTSMSNYFDNILGFDIVRFDEQFINSEDQESVAEAINKKYGQEGEDIVRKLLD